MGRSGRTVMGIVARTKQQGTPVERSTVYNLRKGVGRPRRETVLAVLRACDLTDVDRGPWLDAYDRVFPPTKSEPWPATEASRQDVVGMGKPIRDCDPLALEVHPAVEVPGTGADRASGVLPAYVRRAHDIRLREIVDRARAGSSRLVTLVGESSTGKTRACWEAIKDLPGPWRLWHPFDPSRLGQVGPHTVVWLNEAQLYLAPADPALAQRVAAGLRKLLHDPERGPVLVLATLWPEHWNALTAPPADGGAESGARLLLEGGDRIAIPAKFTAADLDVLSAVDDPRPRLAAAQAEGRRITQYLAGAPELSDRYLTASPSSRALLDAAIDARRLGHPRPLPRALLEQAASGYLDDFDWDALDDNWLDRAFDDLAQRRKGAPGPLTRIRPRPGTPDGPTHYRLADYLEQAGARQRAEVFPPDSLWAAFATTITDPDVLGALAYAASRRARDRHAYSLYKVAADLGLGGALYAMGVLREQAEDRTGSEILYQRGVDQGDPGALWALIYRREEEGDLPRAIGLYRDLAVLGETDALWSRAADLERRGDVAAAEALYGIAAEHSGPDRLRDLAATALSMHDRRNAEVLLRRLLALGDTDPFWHLGQLREQAGDYEEAEGFYRKAVAHGQTGALRHLAELREHLGDQTEAAALHRQADLLTLGQPAQGQVEAGNLAEAETRAERAARRGESRSLWVLAGLRAAEGDVAGALSLAERAGADAAAILSAAAQERERAGDPAIAAELILHAADHGGSLWLLRFARQRRWAGNPAGAEDLYRMAAERGHTEAFRHLAMIRDAAGDLDAAERLYRSAINRGSVTARNGLASVRAKAGDATGAELIIRYGLTGDGRPGEDLDI